jgi:hypothetical protein
MTKTAKVAVAAALFGGGIVAYDSAKPLKPVAPTARVVTAAANTLTEYPLSMQVSFLQGCELAGSKSECLCVLQQLEANVPLSDAVLENGALEAGDTEYPSWYTSAIKACS